MNLLPFRRLSLNDREKRIFRLHFWYSVLEGVLAGILILNEFVFLKSLKGSAYEMGILFQFSVLIYLLLIFANEFLKRIRDKRKFLRLTGLVTRLPLLLLIFFPRSGHALTGCSACHLVFLFIFLVYYLSTPVVYPYINLFLKHAYEHINFGVLYGYATAANRIVMLVTTFLYGLLLDHDNYAFTYIFPVMGVMGIFSIGLLSMIGDGVLETGTELSAVKNGMTAKERKRTAYLSKGWDSFWQSVGLSVRGLTKILKVNAPFRHFEIGFMAYGFAYMISNAVVTIFFDRALHLNYSSVAFYKNGFNLLSILLLPFFGRLLGRIDPRKFSVITFLSMLLAILFIALSEYLPFSFDFHGIRIVYLLILYVIFMGIFTAALQLIWYIGSAYFCPREEAGDYQSVHLILTGVRGAMAPTLGVFLYKLAGFTITFSVAMLLLAAAVGVMVWSYRREGRRLHD